MAYFTTGNDLVNYCVFVILETIIKRMSSVKECEKKRGTAVWELQEEIRMLRKECGRDKPNVRSVVKMVASLNTARVNLIETHLTLVTKMNAQPDEPRFTQFMTPLMDAVEEVKALAEDIIEAED